MSPLDPIPRCPLFDGVPLETVQKLIPRRAPVELETGTVLLRPECCNASLYIVWSGSLAVHLDSLSGQIYRLLGPGRVVGEISLIRRCRPTAYVVAMEPTTVLSLGEAELWDLIRGNERVCRNLMTMLADTIVDNTHYAIDGMQRIAALELMSRNDALTALYNRRWLDHHVERLLLRQQDGGPGFTLILIDVDHFRRYNARHGHVGGDRALVALARMLTNAVRPGDCVARYGGEELVVLLPETTAREAVGVAQRLLEGARKLAVRGANGEALSPLTVSIGLAESWPGATAEALIHAADVQLYRAKQQGRDCLCHADLPADARDHHPHQAPSGEAAATR